MRPPLLWLAAVVLLATPSFAQTFYAYGSFCSTCQSPTAANQFYDDGLHDDGAAGDGIWGAIVTVDRPAGRYSWCAAWEAFQPGVLSCGWPICWCEAGNSVAFLWTSGPGDVIHFRRSIVNDPSWGGQWLSAGSHGVPPGTHLAVEFGPVNRLCTWPEAGTGHTAQLNGTTWQRVVTIPTPGTYDMRFQTLEDVPGDAGGPVFYSEPYNAMCCLIFPFLGDCPRYVRFTTTQPNSDVMFEFNVTNGRMRGVELGPTPTRIKTWGALKTIYR